MLHSQGLQGWAAAAALRCSGQSVKVHAIASDQCCLLRILLHRQIAHSRCCLQTLHWNVLWPCLLQPTAQAADGLLEQEAGSAEYQQAAGCSQLPVSQADKHWQSGSCCVLLVPQMSANGTTSIIGCMHGRPQFKVLQATGWHFLELKHAARLVHVQTYPQGQLVMACQP